MSEAAQTERRRQFQTEAAADVVGQWMQLVTSARFVKRKGRGREGEGADRQPVERSNPRDGHGTKGGMRKFLESGRNGSRRVGSWDLPN